MEKNEEILEMEEKKSEEKENSINLIAPKKNKGKLFILSAAIIAIGTCFVANKSYQEKIENNVINYFNLAKSKGVEVSFASVDSSLFSNDIKVNEIKIKQMNNISSIKELIVDRHSFDVIGKEKPRYLNLKIKEMKIAPEYNFNKTDVFDIDLNYKMNEAANNFIANLKIDSKNHYDFNTSLRIYNAFDAWKCINSTPEECPIQLTEQSLTESIGDAFVDKFDIYFKNEGYIEEKFPNYSQSIDLMETMVKNSKIKEDNKNNIIEFIKNKDLINISLSQTNKTIKSSVLDYSKLMNSGKILTENDLLEFFLSQFEITTDREEKML